MEDQQYPFSPLTIEQYVDDISDVDITLAYMSAHNWGWKIHQSLLKESKCKQAFRPIDIVWGFYYIAGVWTYYGLSSDGCPVDILAIVRLLRQRGFDLNEDERTRANAYLWWNELYDELKTYVRISLGSEHLTGDVSQLPLLDISQYQITFRQLLAHLRTQQWILQEAMN